MDKQVHLPSIRFQRGKNSMVSNFNMPMSTMLMLVCSYGGYELIMDAYNIALKEDYRFGTYGDAMLILDK